MGPRNGSRLGAPADVAFQARPEGEARLRSARIYRVLLVASVAWGVLAFGAVYPWAYWPLAVGISAVGISALATTRGRADARARMLGAALLAVGSGIALQFVPLPQTWVAVVSPAAQQFLAQYQLGFQRTGGGAQTLSIDPDSTWVVLVLFTSLALLLVGLTRGMRHIGLDWFLTQMTGLGVGVAVLGVIQRVLVPPMPPIVYGFWHPLQGGNPFGPFVNRNHFAGWMVMAIPLVLGHAWALASQRNRPRGGGWRDWLWWTTTVEANRVVVVAFAVVVMALSLVLTGSRSGILAFIMGLASITACVFRRLQHRTARLIASAYLGLVCVGAIAWAGLGRTLDRFEPASGDFSHRFQHWHVTWQVISDFVLTGSGLGTYGRAMLVYQTSGRELMYAQAHNDYLQLAAEGGLLVGLPATCVIVMLVRSIRYRLATEESTAVYWVRVGALGGLVGIAVQSLVEFSLQIPANAVLFVVLLSLALHRPARLTPHAHRV